MSTDELHRAWKSPANRPSPEMIARDRESLVATLRREHRGFVFRMVAALVLLAVPTGGLIDHLVNDGPFSFSGEWSVLLLLALPWVGAGLFIRRQLRHRREHRDYDRSVRQTCQALLDANQAAQHRARVLFWLFGFSVPVVAVCILQLQAVGKARPNEAASLAVVLGTILAGSAAAIFWEYRRLRPEENRLAGLVAEFAD